MFIEEERLSVSTVLMEGFFSPPLRLFPSLPFSPRIFTTLPPHPHPHHRSLFGISSACRTVFIPFFLLILPVSSTCSRSASFHLFPYLSQWELMWPLCAVSSPRGRQSSSAPIRTALSGAANPLLLSLHMPPTTHRQKRQEKREEKNKTKHRARESSEGKEFDSDGVSFLSFTRSVCLHLPFHPSLTVFTSTYLCFGPEGVNTVSIPASQTAGETHAIVSQSLHPWTLSQLSLIITFFSPAGGSFPPSFPFLFISMFTCWELTAPPPPLFV